MAGSALSWSRSSYIVVGLGTKEVEKYMPLQVRYVYTYYRYAGMCVLCRHAPTYVDSAVCMQIGYSAHPIAPKYRIIEW